ncbi:hypothetical protein RI844_04390 [Thalassotalea fonticola]|uniref:Uncharacterized protein n=1 Tax=Thalassotalea fonticola TaxID=3065649 RepID=A0ABZ0GS94_9GAMM|nr:hypothetical protein RI844_04390 [Colwelliaceae bacterium S1-1]
MNMSKYFIAVITSSMFITNPALSQDAGNASNKLSQLDCSTNQIAKFDGENWVCAEDVKESGGYVVIDSEGKEVAEVFPRTIGGYYSVIRTKYTYQTATGTERAIMLQLTKERLADGVNIVFKELNCQGPVYMYSNNLFLSGFDYRAATLVDPVSGDATVWVSKNGIPEETTLTSYMTNFGECRNFSSPSTRLLIEAEVLYDDFHEVYPPPYHMEER